MKKRIETRKLFICEQHFTEHQYDTRKSLKEEELPKINLPIKSLNIASTTYSRSTLAIQAKMHSET